MADSVPLYSDDFSTALLAYLVYRFTLYIESVPNRNSAAAVLLRESFRDRGKIRKCTLANLTHWSSQRVEHFRVWLRGGVRGFRGHDCLERSLPHGHVAAVLGTLRASGSGWFAASLASVVGGDGRDAGGGAGFEVGHLADAGGSER
ncbi:MAG: hypothetical protein ACRERU_07425 [Methylococcales bacterium]